MLLFFFIEHSRALSRYPGCPPGGGKVSDADPNNPTQATLVNAGKYWGHSDVIVLGATGHF
ncbi:MAG: hypothetical protein U0230_08865 [Polyangiales bacterium]